MNKFNLTAFSAAFCLAISTSAIGAMSKAEYKAAKDDISAKYKSDNAACKAMTGNAKDICIEEAKGREKVAKADAKLTEKTADAKATAREKTEDANATARAKATEARMDASADGKAVFEKSCKGCHSVMKPKMGDKAAWAPLIKQGADALTAVVVKGKAPMPPKDGAASEADVKAAVEYMISQNK